MNYKLKQVFVRKARQFFKGALVGTVYIVTVLMAGRTIKTAILKELQTSFLALLLQFSTGVKSFARKAVLSSQPLLHLIRQSMVMYF